MMGFQRLFLSQSSLMTRAGGGSLATATAHLLGRRTFARSAVVDVPPECEAPERPVTLILAEDAGVYKNSWHPTMEQALPQQNGIPYSNFHLSATAQTFDDALREMKKDVGSVMDAVLVTRGPFASWMAQFYLEDLPLKGLVMVDPMQLDDQNGVNQFQLHYEKLGLTSSQQYKLYQDYSEHWDHWTLQLEPGAVPMMILYTTDRPAFKRCAENTALRHRVGDDEDEDSLPIVKLPATKSNHEKEVIKTIVSWVTQRVL
mmetsp:Transcript_15468/g.42755  ORF Transcript_15468/g.42755 Transcript_15468/m.42755 type:complete len:259 (-) Transcript_15468:34-810(-)